MNSKNKSNGIRAYLAPLISIGIMAILITLVVYELNSGEFERVESKISTQTILNHSVEDITEAMQGFDSLSITTAIRSSVGVVAFHTDVVMGTYKGENVFTDPHSAAKERLLHNNCSGLSSLRLQKNTDQISVEMLKSVTVNYSPDEVFDCIVYSIKDLKDSYDLAEKEDVEIAAMEKRKADNQEAWAKIID